MSLKTRADPKKWVPKELWIQRHTNVLVEYLRGEDISRELGDITKKGKHPCDDYRLVMAMEYLTKLAEAIKEIKWL